MRREGREVDSKVANPTRRHRVVSLKPRADRALTVGNRRICPLYTANRTFAADVSSLTPIGWAAKPTVCTAFMSHARSLVTAFDGWTSSPRRTVIIRQHRERASRRPAVPPKTSADRSGFMASRSVSERMSIAPNLGICRKSGRTVPAQGGLGGNARTRRIPGAIALAQPAARGARSLQTLWRTGWLEVEGSRHPRAAGLKFASKIPASTRATATRRCRDA